MSDGGFRWQKLLAMRPIRFLLAGGTNTLLTYLLYLALLLLLPYQVSFAASYVVGIVLAYYMNRIFVFNSHRGASSAILLPFIYLAQYLLGATVMHVWVEVFHQSKHIAPLITAVVTVPLTYLLSRVVFVRPA